MLSKVDLVAKLAERHGITKKDAEVQFDNVIDTLTKEIIAGEDIRIAKFGAFKVKDTKARTARNPMTGGTVEVPAGRKLSFAPAKDLKDAL